MDREDFDDDPDEEMEAMAIIRIGTKEDIARAYAETVQNSHLAGLLKEFPSPVRFAEFFDLFREGLSAGGEILQRDYTQTGIGYFQSKSDDDALYGFAPEVPLFFVSSHYAVQQALGYGIPSAYYDDLVPCEAAVAAEDYTRLLGVEAACLYWQNSEHPDDDISRMVSAEAMERMGIRPLGRFPDILDR